jgi:transposase-like protein
MEGLMEIETGKRRFSREYKLAALSRMAGGTNVTALAAELGVPREYLYAWLRRFREVGPEALRGPGRPTKAEQVAMREGAVLEPSARPSSPAEDLAKAQARISELERKIGRQELELDFFQQALRQVEEARRKNAVAGETVSTRSSGK